MRYQIKSKEIKQETSRLKTRTDTQEGRKDSGNE